MWYDNLFDEIISYKNIEQASQMSAYMKNLFDFLGLKSAERREISKKYFKQIKQSKEIDWGFVFKCWECTYRELQYIAADYLLIKQKYITDKDIDNLKLLIITKSWWDSVDSFNRIFGTLLITFPTVKDKMLMWSTDDNIWLRRTAIICQLPLKDKTDTDMLEKILCNNFGTSEFFINKAVGWSLREYSKTNPDWVKDFIQKYNQQLSKLSIKEGSKYINIALYKKTPSINFFL